MTKEEHDLLAIKEELKRKKQEQVTKKDAAVKEERETVCNHKSDVSKTMKRKVG